MQTTLDPPEDKSHGSSGGGSGGNSGGSGGGGSGRGGLGRGRGSGGSGSGRPRPGTQRGLFTAYKPEQGRWTRNGTLIGGGVMIAWGALSIYDQLQVYAGDDLIHLLITTGVPLAFAVAVFAAAWHLCYGRRSTSDFMIATEGEMKKVNWSTRREVIGSTKVVILFTLLMAALLFLADLGFQQVFRMIGILKS